MFTMTSPCSSLPDTLWCTFFFASPTQLLHQKYAFTTYCPPHGPSWRYPEIAGPIERLMDGWVDGLSNGRAFLYR